MWKWFFDRYLERIFNKGADRVEKLVGNLLRFRKNDKNEYVITEINRQPLNDINIKNFYAHQPRIENCGSFFFNDSQQLAVSKKSQLLQSENRPNDPHAILACDPIWQSDPVVFHVNTLDYAGVLTLREEGIKPRIISSSAVFLCPELRKLIVQRRGKVDTFPNKLHTIGGAYIPSVGSGVSPDRKGLLRTLARELSEETQAFFPIDNVPPMMVSTEVSTGFIQLVLLGVSLSKRSVDDMEGNWEGSIEQIPFDQLPSVLSSRDWVPSGRAHILAWLGIGAPNTAKRQLFGRYSAKELFWESQEKGPSSFYL
ncbi:MAG: hypothetical protein LGR52_06880 [Candidatus Thiosymbion ectosymbiont of Robbea hypermnestra]|nr:hypothetical protein [Candidatus Thiosymbion ectosymbiont of Robbea hypermnestra]